MKGLSFMKAIDMIDLKNVENLEAVFEALEDRCSDLELQEPFDGNDFFYEEWEEKFGEFEYIKDEFEGMLDKFKELLLDDNDEPEPEENIDEEWFGNLKYSYGNWTSSVEGYQILYGGLKRLKVYF